MDERQYEAAALPELRALMEALDEVGDDVEVELAGDILTLDFETGSAIVINSHRAARQIWLAADRRAWHFDQEPHTRAWVARKTGDELWATVSSAVSRRLGRNVTLEH